MAKISLFRFLFFLCLPLTVFSQAQKLPIQKNLSDEQLLDLVQRQTFRYFWDFGHPESGMARERSNATFGYGDEVVTSSGRGICRTSL